MIISRDHHVEKVKAKQKAKGTQTKKSYLNNPRGICGPTLITGVDMNKGKRQEELLRGEAQDKKVQKDRWMKRLQKVTPVSHFPCKIPSFFFSLFQS